MKVGVGVKNERWIITDAISTTTDIQHIKGAPLSDAQMAEYRKNNKCFYCGIKYHQAKECRKKQAAQNKRSGGTSSSFTPPANRTKLTARTTEAPIEMTANAISGFLKGNMSSLDEDTKLSIIDSLMPQDFIQAQN